MDATSESVEPESDVDLLARIVKQRFDAVDKRLDGLDDSMFDIKERLDGFDQRFDSFDKMLSKVLRIQAAMLTTMDSIDGKLNDIGDHTERIIRLEENVFGPGK